MTPWLSLDWERCRDGVEVFDYGPARPAKEGKSAKPLSQPKRSIRLGIELPKSGRYFRWISREATAINHELSPTEPLIISFASAATDEALVELFGEIGLPAYAEEESPRETSAKVIYGWQKEFRSQLELLKTGGHHAAISAINQQLLRNPHRQLTPWLRYGRRKAAPMLHLMAENLYAFMQMELAMMAVGGTGINSCEQCGGLFPTGSGTRRYARSIYCSARCRVAADRARKKQKGEG